MAKLSPQELERRAERKRKRIELSELLLQAGTIIDELKPRRKKAPQGMISLEVNCKCGHHGDMLLPAARVAQGVTMRCSHCGAKRKFAK